MSEGIEKIDIYDGEPWSEIDSCCARSAEQLAATDANAMKKMRAK